MIYGYMPWLIRPFDWTKWHMRNIQSGIVWMLFKNVLTRFRTRMRIECILPDARWQRFSQELVIVLVLLLNLSLSPLPHSVTDVTLEAEAQSHHWITDTENRAHGWGFDVPVSPVSLTVPTRNFQSRFKRQILVANWKKIPASFTDKEVL